MIDLSALFTTDQVFETSFVVEPDDTVGNFSPHMSTLVSTPAISTRLARFCRDCCDANLPEGYITVGCSMTIEHTATAALGTKLHVKATLAALEGNRIKLHCDISDALGTVVRCFTERAVVLHCALAEQAEERARALLEQRS